MTEDNSKNKSGLTWTKAAAWFLGGVIIGVIINIVQSKTEENKPWTHEILENKFDPLATAMAETTFPYT